jgi:hypothetical protein
LRKRYIRFEVIFDAARKRIQVLELEKKIAKPEFWNNQEVVWSRISNWIPE